MTDDKALIQKALRFIGIRPRSTSELKNYLSKQKASQSQSDRIIKYLQDRDLLNDSDFAAWFASSRANFKFKSQRQIASELKKFGIVSQISTDDAATAEKLIRKKFPTRPPGPDRSYQQKIFAYLLKRGFKYSSIEQAIRKLYNRD